MRCVERGFSLLEVVIALAVVAAALAAAVTAVGRGALTQERLEARTHAHWVAMNRLVEALLDTRPDAPSEDAGIDQLGRERWRWQRRSDQTADPRIRRIAVRVARDNTQTVLAEVSGYAGTKP